MNTWELNKLVVFQPYQIANYRPDSRDLRGQNVDPDSSEFEAKQPKQRFRDLAYVLYRIFVNHLVKTSYESSNNYVMKHNVNEFLL